jgi:apoptosis-inducing factor 2
MTSVVIVGGGFAGLSAAKNLIKAGGFEVTLVDRKDYFEVTMAQVRALVDPEAWHGKSRFLYRDVLEDRFIQAEVVGLDSRSVQLSTGQSLAFDNLILAPGTRYARLPLAKPWDEVTLEQRQEALRDSYRQAQDADSYLVVGGGLVGIELAGQIAAAAPGKKVRLAHKGERLAQNLVPRASEQARSDLARLGVEVLLNTADAQAEPGDLVLDATSPSPATEFLSDVEPSILDERGRIRVNEDFEVEGHPGWFAVGDANDSPEAKLSTSAANQGAWVAKFLSGKTKKRYRPWPVLAIVPVGDDLGFSQTPLGVRRWKIVLDMKRKDYLVNRSRKTLGAG